jgi:4,5-dihydroxyphthalate decarboxylase
MTKTISITIACNAYDRTRPLKDGRVPVEGCEVRYLTYEAEELFFRALRYDEFDVAELSFSGYMILFSRGISPYIAIPAFVSRFFRHSSIYIRTDRGISEPADLKGRTVGLPEYSQTAGVWMRGILEDDFGVRPSDVKWRAGGLEEPGRDERMPLMAPHGVDLQSIPQGETLTRMLKEGKLDAVMTARALSSYVKGEPNIGRLFPNYQEVERNYYNRTKIFPPMHLIGIRKNLAERHPWLPANVYKAFCQAKAIALNDVREVGWPHVTLPWVDAQAGEISTFMGADYWRYGVSESAHEIETLIRYAHDQGLLARKLSVEELFAPTTLATSKI